MTHSAPGEHSLTAVGAAFAACVMTSVPGLTLLLSNAGKSAPDLRALADEIVCGTFAAIFGALVMRGRMQSRAPWLALLPLAAYVASVFVFGALFVFDVGGGSVDSGPIILVGLVGVIGVAIGATVLGAVTWLLLASLAKTLERDAASHVSPAASASRWLGIAAIVHVVVKGATGGPTLFGLLAGVFALSLAVRAKRNLGMVLGALSMAASLVTSVGVRVFFARKNALERLPLCQDLSTGAGDSNVISSRVRAMPGVADVMVFSPPPYEGPNITVVVLPIGGGPVPTAMKDAIVRDATSSGCVVDTIGTKPVVTVVDPKYVEFAVVAHAHLAPGCDADEARKALIASARDFYEPRAGARLLRDPQSSGDETPPTPPDAGVSFVEWKTGDDDLGTRIDGLAIGSVAKLGRIDVVLVGDHDH